MQVILHYLRERRGLKRMARSSSASIARRPNGFWRRSAQRSRTSRSPSTPAVPRRSCSAAQDRRTAAREQIKRRIQDGEIRLVCATDAACEGLNLQRLGAQVNIDLPWNPSRLEQRKGRVQRIGQVRDDVHVLNLRYAGTVEDRGLRGAVATVRRHFLCARAAAGCV